jgi:outer membrane receptor protein involved in Fe transport
MQIQGVTMKFSFRASLLSSLAMFAFVPAAQAQAPATDQAQDAAQNDGAMPDIVVTATKRSERLVEVPLSISVVDASAMASQNLVALQDIVARVPGLSVNAMDSGRVQLSIRGISTGGLNNNTVGITVDDVPVGGSTGVSYGAWLVPELDPGVLQQLEVLRGPQGTLYGASSLGGLLRYVTANPRVDRFSGSVALSGTSVAHGGTGFGARAMVNVPIAENAAVMVNGFFRRDPGYVDDASRGLKNMNRVDNWGGRAALRWDPTETLSVKLSALIQKTDGKGSSEIDADASLTPIVDYNQTRPLGTGPFSRKLQLYTGTLGLDLGFATLTSVTGYSIIDSTAVQDFSPGFEAYAQIATGRTDVAAVTYFSSRTKKFSQEVRLASPSTDRFEWLIGGFFTDEKSDPYFNLVAVDRATGAMVGEVLPDRFPNEYKEYASFASFTYHFTDRVDIQAGGRYGRNEQVYDELITGPFYDPPYVAHAQSAESVFTYSLTPRFRISPNMTLYARIASGYRPGGPNPGVGIGLPATYGSDTTTNYEIGYKVSLFDRMLSLEASIYRIDWKDIQLMQIDPVTQYSYNVNASRARSQGFEIAASLRPVPPLTLAATLGYNDAELREDIPTIAGSPAKGTPLPFSTPWSASLAADYDLAVGNDTTASFGFTINYLDRRKGNFQAYGQALYPAFTTADLRASLEHQGWMLSAFGSNIFDKRVAISGDERAIGFPVYQILINRPRTFGVELSKRF